MARRWKCSMHRRCRTLRLNRMGRRIPWRLALHVNCELRNGFRRARIAALARNTPMSFASLGLIDLLLRNVQDLNYQTPTPVQAKAIPAVLSGKDVMAAAQTGTGKTAGFGLPPLPRVPRTRPAGVRT